jgi:AcrR family transcriptional regulator
MLTRQKHRVGDHLALGADIADHDPADRDKCLPQLENRADGRKIGDESSNFSLEEDSDMAAPRRPNPDKIIDAAMSLAAQSRWREVTLAGIADEAKVSLAQLHETFRSKPAIVAALGDRVDREVLEGTDAAAGAEPVHDRLLDVIMRRLDALAPYKDGIASILRDTVCDPAAALCASPGMLRRMSWCLEAAGVSSAGMAGRIRAKGLTAIYISTLMVWLRDDSPDQGRTMAHLDKSLRRAGRLAAALSLAPRGPRPTGEEAVT